MGFLPDRYRELREEELERRIRSRKKLLGDRLLILAHHYQRQEVIEFADLQGDSLGLSRSASSRKNCEFIVFCGVNFMAESAEILRQEHQTVQHPDTWAGCPMADMADYEDVMLAWKVLTEAAKGAAFVPVTYMNSSAELKAFCGRNDGTVCTSSNAENAFEWAMKRGEKIIFFPDEHLGRNTARRIGVPEKEILVWDPSRSPEESRIREKARKASLVLWKGFCNVHTRFRLDHVCRVREHYPEGKIVVHPECTSDVVEEADAVGSTEFICRYVEDSAPGTLIFIGTELNLVGRLASQHPDKRIYELARSLCPNMFRIDLAKVLWTLEEIGLANRVYVDPDTKVYARLALERMFDLTSPAGPVGHVLNPSILVDSHRA